MDALRWDADRFFGLEGSALLRLAHGTARQKGERPHAPQHTRTERLTHHSVRARRSRAPTRPHGHRCARPQPAGRILGSCSCHEGLIPHGTCFDLSCSDFRDEICHVLLCFQEEVLLDARRAFACLRERVTVNRSCLAFKMLKMSNFRCCSSMRAVLSPSVPPAWTDLTELPSGPCLPLPTILARVFKQSWPTLVV